MKVLQRKFVSDVRVRAELGMGLSLPMEALHPEFLEWATQCLTYSIPPTPTEPEGTEIHGFLLTGDSLVVPRRWADLPVIRENFEIFDERSDGRKLVVESSPIVLRDARQQMFVDAIWQELSAGRSAYGIAAPGVGKTVMAIEVARRLGVSVAVVVHKDFLADQWLERLGQFWPAATVGRCQQKRCDTGHTHDVVICMVQSVSKYNKYAPEFWSSFGLVIFDESHRMGAEHWNPVMFAFRARRFLMLSATPNRKDGMHDLQFLQSADPTVVIEASDCQPRIESRVTNIRVSPRSYMFNGKPNWGRLLTILSRSLDRNRLVVADVARAAKAGRKVLVASERREQLVTLSKMLLEIDPTLVIDQYVGGRSKEELGVASEAQVIMTTYQLTSEGLDIPSLDTLVMATPRSDVVQVIGRILRAYPGKKEPVVVDYLDDIPEMHGMTKKRRKTYKERAYTMGGTR